MPAPGSADAALEAVAGARVTVVIGASDTGKTSLVTRLAGALAARGLAVAVVDADLGQSEIGPPMTIGLGRVRGPLTRLADAELLAVEFVGATSPAARVPETARATRAMVAWALAAGAQRVLVDTCGLVEGELGRWLKRAKVEAVDPDLVVALERCGECEHVVAVWDGAARPRVLRLAVEAGVVRRSAETRRRHRARALDACLAAAVPVEVDLGRIPVRDAAGAPAGLAGAVRAGGLVGLRDAAGRTLGLGRVGGMDPGRPALQIVTAVPAAAIASITLADDPRRRPPGADRGSRPAA